MKKTIIFYIKDPNGGTGRFLEHMEWLFGKQKKMRLIFLSHIPTRGFFLKTKVIGIQAKKQTNFSFFKIYQFIKNFLAFYKECNVQKPSIVFSLDIYANIICLCLKQINPTFKLIISTHVNLNAHLSEGRNKIYAQFLTFLIKKLYKNADTHYVPGLGLKNQLIDRFGVPKNKIVQIPYPINKKRIIQLSKKPITNKIYKAQLYKKEKRIFAMARFDQQKNYDLLFKIIKQLVRVKSRYHLYILGEGDQKNYYQEIINQLGIKNYVTFLGWQKNPYQFLKFADIFIFLSKYEGYPYALLEAKALKKYIIASDVDFGPREILANYHNSILLRKKNVSSTILFITNTLLNMQKTNHLL